jgi:hypothetical protein
LIGHTRQWQALERRWTALLREPLLGKPPLKRFHLSPCAALDGEFEGYSRAESDLVRHTFRQVIVENRLAAVGFSVSVRDWDDLVKGRARSHFGSAEATCIGGCIQHAFERAERTKTQFISVTFDSGRMKINGLQNWIERGAKSYKGPVIPIGINFQEVTLLPALQAADIVTTENWWNACDRLMDKSAPLRAHFKHLLGRIVADGFIMDREYIKRTLVDFGRKPRL